MNILHNTTRNIKNAYNNIKHKINNVTHKINEILFGYEQPNSYIKNVTYKKTEYNINLRKKKNPKFLYINKNIFKNEDIKNKKLSIVLKVNDKDLNYKRNITLTGYKKYKSSDEAFNNFNELLVDFSNKNYKVEIENVIINKINE